LATAPDLSREHNAGLVISFFFYKLSQKKCTMAIKTLKRTSLSRASVVSKITMATNKLLYRPVALELKEKFRYWHTEALLNQAADLADKCIEELKEYRTLDYTRAQFANDLDAQKSYLELEKNRKDVFERDLISATERKNFYDRSNDEFARIPFEANKLYSYSDREGQGKAGWTRAGQNAGEVNVNVESRKTEKIMNDNDVAWATEDKAYNEAKFKIKADTLQHLIDLSGKGMPLDLATKRDLVFKRLERNYIDAVDRVFVARIGLRALFGYAPNGPDLGASLSIDEQITNLTIWIRDGIEWLVAYSQLDQSFTRVISFQSLVSASVMSGLHNASEEFSVKIRLPESMFTAHDNVRLKGVSASIIGKAGVVPWALDLRLPTAAYFQRAGARIPIDQSMLPHCLIGRVENRESFRPIEVCGMISLNNASPLGRAPGDDGSWTLMISRPPGTHERFDKIDDILLELNLVGQPI
jgi:hypothetical protein